MDYPVIIPAGEYLQCEALRLIHISRTHFRRMAATMLTGAHYNNSGERVYKGSELITIFNKFH